MNTTIFKSGLVQRYHAHTSVRTKQTLAAHQWGVAMIILMNHKAPSRALVVAALTHDVSEVVTGDIPYTAAKFFPQKEEVEAAVRQELGLAPIDLTPEEAEWLFVADRLEAMYFMGHEGVQWSDETIAELMARAYPLGLSRLVHDLAKELHGHVCHH